MFLVMDYSSKKSLWKWILLYVVIGAVAYGAVYYFFFYPSTSLRAGKNGGYSYAPQNEQIQNSNSETAGWKTYIGDGFELSYLTTDVCPGQGGSDAAGNVSLIELCPQITSGAITVSVHGEKIANHPYFRDLKNSQTMTVGGKTVYQYTINQGGCKGYLTVAPLTGDKTLQISLDNCGAGQVNDLNFPSNGVDYMNQFLSTLKFTK